MATTVNAIFNIILLLAALAASLPPNVLNLVPTKYKPEVEGIIVLLGWLKSQRNLFINPDGTSARTPWEPKDPAPKP